MPVLGGANVLRNVSAHANCKVTYLWSLRLNEMGSSRCESSRGGHLQPSCVWTLRLAVGCAMHSDARVTLNSSTKRFARAVCGDRVAVPLLCAVW